MILVGFFVGAIAAYSGFLYAKVINRKYPLELRDSESAKVEELEARVQVRDEDLPPFWLSIMPILAPLLLIAGNTTLQTIYRNSASANLELVLGFFAFLGNPNIALTFAAAIAIILLAGFLVVQSSGALSGKSDIAKLEEYLQADIPDDATNLNYDFDLGRNFHIRLSFEAAPDGVEKFAEAICAITPRL